MDALDYKQDILSGAYHTGNFYYKQNSLSGIHHMGNSDYKQTQSSVHPGMGTELCYSYGASKIP